MPRTASTRSKSPSRSRAKGRSTSARATHSQSKPRWQLKSIPPERKVDLLGVFFALSGLLLLLSQLSSQRGSLTTWVVNTLALAAGWGSLIVAFLFMIVGCWLVIRNLEGIPPLTAERLLGIISLLVNVLTWIHLFAGGGFDLAALGLGGGYIGAAFERLFMTSVGMAGSLVALVAWLLVSLVLVLDLSIPDLYHRLQPVFVRISQAWKNWLANREAQKSQPVSENSRYAPPPSHEISELPSDFNPLPEKRPSKRVKNQAAGQTNAGEMAVEEDQGATSSGQAVSSTGVQPAVQQWNQPTVEAILDLGTPVSQQSGQDNERARIIEETLASFSTPAHIVEIHRGPTVTQFGVEPDFIENRAGRTRVRVSKIVALADDLALALAAPRIRIQAPVPGRNYVGIEVPNTEIARVALRDVMESESFQKYPSKLRFALGKDVAGRPITADLSAMPHLLIAGTTGSGKSVCVNSILACLLLDNSPVDLRLVLVDPKRVELTGYNGIPHLLAPVVMDTEKVVGILQWMQREMDNRYRKFAQAGARNIEDYNTRQLEHLPFIVVVIDELADLMMLAPEDTERSITRLAQLARATGIHMIIATQRPSVDVVTGLIKANFPARVAFAVASGVDSRVILDQPGAEKLLGRGDMLFQAPDAPAPVRLQGVYVSDHEIQRLVDFWRFSANPASASNPGGSTATLGAETLSAGALSLPPDGLLQQSPLWDLEPKEDGDPLLPEAISLVRKEGRASITMLQRRMRVGYTRAARLVDSMEDKGIIGPSLGTSQVREVLDYGPTAPPEED